jgi:hypothetical protein
MEETIKPEWLKCPECNHMQKDRETCEYCGTSLAKIIRIRKLEQKLQETEQKVKDAEHKVSESSSRKQIIINRIIISIFALAFMSAIVAGFWLHGAAQLADRKQLSMEAAIDLVYKHPALLDVEDNFLNWYADGRKWKRTSWTDKVELVREISRFHYKHTEVIAVVVWDATLEGYMLAMCTLDGEIYIYR